MAEPQPKAVQHVIPNAMTETTKNLYGPWMIATYRQRRTTKIFVSGVITGIEQGKLEGSHFATLPVDVVSGDTQQTFTKNEAYLASNPYHKTKKLGEAKSPTVGMNVVPLATGNGAQVFKHTMHKGLGNHNAISIVEPGKQTVNRASPRYPPTGWANDLANQIDALAAKENLHLNAPVRRDQLHVDMEFSSDDGGSLWLTL
ncbi:hypothetical protein V6N11_012416 [Hibiscus sabdariffa]|uniref:Uncharacterized protein n=1 Tax=Hibiscus sabdariffa TaxID=183260 RepID=A0ABR2QB24_9ROSI